MRKSRRTPAERRLQNFKHRSKEAYDLIGRKPGPMKVKTAYKRDKTKNWRDFVEEK